MGGGPESQINTWNFVRKTSHFFKKTKCPKQPKKQNKPNFHFSLSGVPNVHGGWVGTDVWDKVPKKTFFLTHSLKGVARVGMRDFAEGIASMGGSEV